MKDKRSNRYKTAAWILLIAGIVSFSVINIFSLFFHYSNRIHNEILNRNMEQISLFDTVKDDDVLEELKSIQVDELRPVDALNILYRLQNKLKNRW